MENKLITASRPQSTPLPCKSLRFLYHTIPGRILLKLLASRFCANLSAVFLNSGLSRPMIGRFIRKNKIDMSRYEERAYRSYNDFFTRRQKEGVTVWDSDRTLLAASCDAKLSAYEIDESSLFSIKDSLYRVSDLLEDDALADRFSHGVCLIFRLSVDDYHRYSYIDDGPTGPTRHIPGVLHTVQPIATERYNIYKRNTREVTVQKGLHFGTIAYVEVGAMLIGRIRNHHKRGCFAHAGEEKGYFEFGGSTVVLLFEKDRLNLDPEIFSNTRSGFETPVRLGEILGRAALTVSTRSAARKEEEIHEKQASPETKQGAPRRYAAAPKGTGAGGKTSQEARK